MFYPRQEPRGIHSHAEHGNEVKGRGICPQIAQIFADGQKGVFYPQILQMNTDWERGEEIIIHHKGG